ncbi:hypothetical protein BRX37_22570 [Sphingomonas sp. S-NIH.Pt3_0716]|nr:hypothetical protein BRX37_22570 [Sphingomonas sp. S-NIH.Pt3_0716]
MPRAGDTIRIACVAAVGPPIRCRRSLDCQSACKRDPLSARKRDPLSGLRTVDVTRFLALRAA